MDERRCPLQTHCMTATAAQKGQLMEKRPAPSRAPKSCKELCHSDQKSQPHTKQRHASCWLWGHLSFRAWCRVSLRAWWCAAWQGLKTKSDASGAAFQHVQDQTITVKRLSPQGQAKRCSYDCESAASLLFLKRLGLKGQAKRCPCCCAGAVFLLSLRTANDFCSQSSRYLGTCGDSSVLSFPLIFLLRRAQGILHHSQV